jgi:hypothetical protein
MIEIDIIKRFQTVRLYENRKISNSMWKNKWWNFIKKDNNESNNDF